MLSIAYAFVPDSRAVPISVILGVLMKNIISSASAVILAFAAASVSTPALAAKRPAPDLQSICQSLVTSGYFRSVEACMAYIIDADPTELCKYAQDNGLLDEFGLKKGDCVSNLRP